MLTRSTLLLLRHAEKPLDDKLVGLSAAGCRRAAFYADYLPQTMKHVAGGKGAIDFLFSAASTSHSCRPVQTLTPLADQLGLELNDRYRHDELGCRELADELAESEAYSGSNIVVCWHHGSILSLAEMLAPGSKNVLAAWPEVWPEAFFGWLLAIWVDERGELRPQRSGWREVADFPPPAQRDSVAAIVPWQRTRWRRG